MISQKFCGHTMIEVLYSHLDCWIIRLANRILIEFNEHFHNNSMVIYFFKNSKQVQDKFHNNSVVIQFTKEFWGHLDCWIIRLARRILIEINENFHNDSVVIYFLKNSDQIQEKFQKNSMVIQLLKNSTVIWIVIW